MPGLITLFLTTPRSGTQWVANSFGEVYSDLADVRHEAIGYVYRPREFLRAYDRTQDLAQVERVKEHIDEIAALDDDMAYVEVGFPCAPAIPLFYETFGNRLRVVQLIRHPALVSASLSTHGMYDDEWRGDLSDDIALLPTDPGVFQTHYQERWEHLTRFEKCLFYWTEIHLHGIELEWRYPDLPILRTRFEDLVEDPQANLPRLAHFMDLPYRPEIESYTTQRVDRVVGRRDERIDSKSLKEHALTVALAEHFGYPTDLDSEMVRQRYFSWREFLRIRLGFARQRLASLLHHW